MFSRNRSIYDLRHKLNQKNKQRKLMNHPTDKPALDPIIQKFIDALEAKRGTPLYKLPVNDARKVLDDLQASAAIEIEADIEDRTLPVGPHGSVDIRIIRPKGNSGVLPAIIYIHGAGWVLGGKESHDRLVREIANGSQAAVILVDFHRAPEAQYPSIHEEGYEVAQWVAQNSAALNIDNSRMVVAGDSIGGLVATAIAMMSQQRGGPNFILQLLFYPVTNAEFDTPSYKQFAQGPWLTEPAMEWFWDAYVPDKAMRKDPLVSPLLAPRAQLQHLPPALIMTNEYDVLRDEGEAYAHKLIQAGVPVVAVRYLGVIHDCALINAITQAPAVRAMIAQANQTLKAAFAKKVA